VILDTSFGWISPTSPPELKSQLPVKSAVLLLRRKATSSTCKTVKQIDLGDIYVENVVDTITKSLSDSQH
jgi:hypothetical protein